MKLKLFSIVAVAAVALSSCGGGMSSSAKLSSEIDSVSYFMGYMYGHGMVNDYAKIPGNSMNFDAMGIGFFNGIAGEEMALMVDDRPSYLNGFFTDLRQAAADTVPIEGDDNGNTSISANGIKTVVKDRTDSACYVLGYHYGNGFVEGIGEMPGEAPNLDLVKDGFKIGITNDTASFTYDGDVNGYLRTYFMRVEAEQREKELEPVRKEMAAYLEANKAKEGVKVTESGLQYEVIKEGNGPKPKATDKVKVHYHGTTIDGTVFDSSVDKGTPFETPLNRVIPGWTEGVQLMSVGSKYKFTIPAELAYGDRGAGPNIGPGAALIFEIELLDILSE